MLPLRDINPTRRIPVLTYGLIVVNVLVFFWELTLSEMALTSAFYRYSVVPAQVLLDPLSLETLMDFVRSMFFHGGWAHLIGNMLYLWLFGDNLEDRMGIPLFLGLYFASGFVASIAQIVVDPTSQIPLVGASGAIAGVLGGYLILFPSVKVRGIIPLGWFARAVEWPAWAVLGLWFVLQLFNGAISLGVQTGVSGGVAFFAHIGGFVAGLFLTGLFMMVVPQPPRQQRQEMLYERARRYRY
jgi:membrane associated rhomboid family serine protease